MDIKFYCIHSRIENQWWCKHCKKTHNKLYKEFHNGNSFCDSCVPDFVRKKAIHINQNQQLINPDTKEILDNKILEVIK